MNDILLPAMSPARRAVLESALSQARTYLEFGVGGSTVLAARLGVPLTVAVDSSAEWVSLVGQQVASQRPRGEVQLLHADLGPTREWGYPVDGQRMAQWPTYYAGAWEAVLSRGARADLVLVDGRFRVPCFLYSLLQLQRGATVLWDDYRDRPEYHRVERHLKPLAFADEMAIFRIDRDLATAEIAAELFRCLYLVD